MEPNYTSAQADSIFAELWDEISADARPVAAPSGHIFGGQPGAGKSVTLKAVQGDPLAVLINGDEFRKYHPLHERLIDDETRYAALTQPFANEMVERCLQKALDQRYPLIVEGTMRNPAVPTRTATLLKAQRYRVEAHVVTTHPALSWLSCQLRYEKQKALDGFGRTVDRHLHDIATAALAGTVAYLEVNQAVDRLSIYDRDGLHFSQIPEPPADSPLAPARRLAL